MFIFFTIIFLLLAISALFNGHISVNAMKGYTESFLTQSKLALSDDDNFDEKKFKNATIGLAIGAGLMLVSALVKLIYLAFAFNHDPITYPTLAMALIVIVSYAVTVIKDKLKKRKTIDQKAEEIAKKAVEDVFKEKAKEALESGDEKLRNKTFLEILEQREKESTAEMEKNVKNLEEALAALKKRGFWGITRDILSLAYYGYMLYAIIFIK